MQGLEPERLCDHCSQARKDRVECRSCLANLCIRCWNEDERQGPWLRKHYQEQRDHKELSLVLPKHFYMLKDYEGSCYCIDDPSCISHCDRCLKRKYILPVHLSASGKLKVSQNTTLRCPTLDLYLQITNR